MLHAIHEHPVVYISVGPEVEPVLIFRLVINEATHIDVPRSILQAVAVLAVILEVSFVETQPIATVKQQSIPVIELIADFSEVDCPYRPKQLQLA